MEIPVKVKPGQEIVIRITVEDDSTQQTASRAPSSELFFGGIGTERGKRVLLLYDHEGHPVTRRRFTDQLIEDLATGRLRGLDELPGMEHRVTWNPFDPKPEDIPAARSLITRVFQLGENSAPRWHHAHKEFIEHDEDGRMLRTLSATSPDWLAEEEAEYNLEMGEPYDG